jgi:Domain of unknown function (DUF397)
VDWSRAAWRKSTRSGTNGCVEVALLDGKVGVRDSKDRGGSVLEFTAQQWASFLDGVRAGEFDRGEHGVPALNRHR